MIPDMKKITLLGLMNLIFLSFLFCGHTKAQSFFLNKLSFSYGGGTVPEFIGTTEGILENLFEGGTKTTNTSATGALCIQYDRTISPQWSIGVSFIYEVITKDAQPISSGPDLTVITEYTATYSTILFNASYFYLIKPNMELYARLGVGMCFNKEEVSLQETSTDNNILMGYQISPIGIIVGKKLFFKAEAGFGYAGIAFAGAGYRF